MKIAYGTIAALLIALASASNAAGATAARRCRTNPGTVARCFNVHGRMSVWMWSPSVRIWRIGTKRMLGVLPSEHPVMPAVVWKQLAPGVFIYADYRVCPFTLPEPGQMQMVCVQSASRVVVQSYIEDDKHPTIRRLPGTYVLATGKSSGRSS